VGRFSVPIPNLIGGVSQQAPQLRLVGQAESQTNAYPSLVDGLMRRHPIDHVAAVDDLSSDTVYPPLDEHVHLINRDPDERYLVRIHDTTVPQQVEVYELDDGTPIPVFGPQGDPADFTYLETLDDAPANVNVKAITIAEATASTGRPGRYHCWSCRRPNSS